MNFLHVTRGFAAAAAAALVSAAVPVTAADMASAGESAVYRLVNGYNRETVGQVRYEVATADSNRITFSVTPDNAAAGSQRTEILTKEGNWLKREMESHGAKVEYEFTTAYPAFVFPLDSGKSWSTRVGARVPATGETRSVRVDGRVMGTERVRVPAGEFDAVKVRRLVYPGDGTYFLPETHVVEIDWYAPALGRVVRSERRSEWIDHAQCSELGSCLYYGAWDVYELVQAPKR